jgi:hypothetical protein
LILLKYYIFVQTFHSIHFAGFSMLNQKHFAKRTFVNDFLDCEILQSHLLFFVPFTFQKSYGFGTCHV